MVCIYALHKKLLFEHVVLFAVNWIDNCLKNCTQKINDLGKNIMRHLTDQKGFTLIEVIMVMVIIGVMAVGSMPAFSAWQANMHIRGAADDLRANMQRARVEAIKQNRHTAIIFDPANNTYVFCKDSGADGNWATLGDNTIVETVNLPSYGSGVAYGHGTLTGSKSATTPPGTFPAGDVSFPGNRVVFDSRGIGNPAGYVYLDNDRQDRVYVVGSLLSGSIVARKWNGTRFE